MKMFQPCKTSKCFILVNQAANINRNDGISVCWWKTPAIAGVKQTLLFHHVYWEVALFVLWVHVGGLHLSVALNLQHVFVAGAGGGAAQWQRSTWQHPSQDSCAILCPEQTVTVKIASSFHSYQYLITFRCRWLVTDKLKTKCTSTRPN